MDSTVSVQAPFKRLVSLARSKGGTFAAYSFVSNVLTGASGIVVIRFLDPLSLGWWNSSQLLRMPLDLLRAGVLSGMSREYPQLVGAGKHAEATRVLETGYAYTLLTIGVSQLVVAAVLLTIGRQDHMLFLGLAASGVAWALGSFSQHVRSMLRTSNQFLLMARVGLAVAVFDTAGVLLVWRFGYIGLLLRSVLSVALTAVLFRVLQPVKVSPRFHWPLLRRMFAFGRHPFFTSFLLLFGANAERILLLTLPDGVRLVGLYTPALLAASLLQIVPGNLQSYHYPKAIEEFGRTEDLQVLRRSTIGLIKRTAALMSGMSFAVAVGMVLLVKFWLPSYGEALWPALIVCASGPFLAFRMAATYFAALHRWPEYYAYTILQCALPYLAIPVGFRLLPPLPAAAAGSTFAVAFAGTTFLWFLVATGRRRGVTP